MPFSRDGEGFDGHDRAYSGHPHADCLQPLSAHALFPARCCQARDRSASCGRNAPPRDTGRAACRRVRVIECSGDRVCPIHGGVADAGCLDGWQRSTIGGVVRRACALEHSGYLAAVRSDLRELLPLSIREKSWRRPIPTDAGRSGAERESVRKLSEAVWTKERAEGLKSAAGVGALESRGFGVAWIQSGLSNH